MNQRNYWYLGLVAALLLSVSACAPYHVHKDGPGNGAHNHDGQYAAVAHNHDRKYAKREYAARTQQFEGCYTVYMVDNAKAHIATANKFCVVWDNGAKLYRLYPSTGLNKLWKEKQVPLTPVPNTTDEFSFEVTVVDHTDTHTGDSCTSDCKHTNFKIIFLPDDGKARITGAEVSEGDPGQHGGTAHSVR